MDSGTTFVIPTNSKRTIDSSCIDELESLKGIDPALVTIMIRHIQEKTHVASKAIAEINEEITKYKEKYISDVRSIYDGFMMAIQTAISSHTNLKHIIVGRYNNYRGIEVLKFGCQIM